LVIYLFIYFLFLEKKGVGCLSPDVLFGTVTIEPRSERLAQSSRGFFPPLTCIHKREELIRAFFYLIQLDYSKGEEKEREREREKKKRNFWDGNCLSLSSWL
jgi:hypothetical protein